MSTKKTGTKRRWIDEDDQFLLQMVNRHVSRKKMAEVMGRTEKAITDRLTRTHREAWSASNHPESRHRKPDRDTTDVERLESKIDGLSQAVQRIDTMLAKLLSELHGQPQDEDSARVQ